MQTIHPIVVCIGEILWDMFPTGPRFGGAPANFAHHAASLGAKVSLVSGVGNDELGNTALRMLRESAIDTRFVTVDEKHPTGTVQVEIDSQGHATYRFNDDEAWDHIPWSTELRDLARQTDAVCFGTLSQRNRDSRETVRKFILETQPDTLRVLDLNLRAPFYDEEVIQQSLKIANVLKLNDDELKLVADRFVGSGDELDQAKKIQEKFGLKLVAVTRGVRGSLLVRDDEWSDEPAQPIKVRDTVGAGDTYTAAVTMGLLHEMPLAEINRRACRMAEYVCSQPGATPKLPDELLRLGRP